MEEIDILINNIENRNYHRQIKTETTKFTYKFKYWFYNLLIDHTDLVIIFISCLFTVLAFGSLAIFFMLGEIFFISATFICAIGIPLGYVLICSLLMDKLIHLARQLKDEVS